MNFSRFIGISPRFLNVKNYDIFCSDEKCHLLSKETLKKKRDKKYNLIRIELIQVTLQKN